MLEFLAWCGIAYIFLDLVFALILGRCVMPGLKCNACKERKN